MAIDTAAKRLSSLDFEEVWAEGLPLPDGTISQADRQHSLWSYSGILAVAAAVPTAVITLHAVASRTVAAKDSRTVYARDSRTVKAKKI
jgi:hypothetical protein